MDKKYKFRGERISEAKRMKQSEFLNRATAVHGSRYDYSKSLYVNAHTKIKIGCSEHGIFEQRPHDHVKGKNGCPVCGAINRRKNHSKQAFDKFLILAKKIHQNKYQYIVESYTGITDLMEIVCPIHGVFKQSADIHKRGNGCQRCGSGPISNMSQQWLDSLNIVDREYWITINEKRYKVDGYDINSNTIYEFLGDYWHGNPKVHHPEKINSHNKHTFKELYEGTIVRLEIFKKAGYNLVFIWENDYLKPSDNSSLG
jgi:hypothetical protein